MLTSRYQYSLRQDVLLSVAWLAFLVFTSVLSFQLRNFTSSLLLYLPTAVSIGLVHWYGYRILPAIYINAFATLVIWNSPDGWGKMLLIATHEPVVAFASRFLVQRFKKKGGEEGLMSTDQFVRFVAFGLVIPVGINSIYTYTYSFVNGDLSKVSLLWLSDFITIFSLSLPVLYFIRPGKKLLEKAEPLPFNRTGQVVEFMVVVFAFLAFSFLIPFGQYWFIYGIVAVVIAVRQGFAAVLLINAVIFLINYVLPLVENSTALVTSTGSTQLINVHLGNATMLFISTLVGRVVSDLRATEENLLRQKQEVEKTNLQLNQTNQELDRFVYSVSHDLSAPLKSIQGLIKISRMEAPATPYLDMMDKSATRLNDFINEVLDYAKTSRKEIIRQEVNIAELIGEIKERLSVEAANKSIQFIPGNVSVLFTDAMLLKVALGNLMSNAIKFQKKIPGHQPQVEIKINQRGQQVEIDVIDNGEGIPDQHQAKVFEMFYRATANSPGSGLGLYIAREAIHKLDGRIAVTSVYGEGSTFTIVLPID